MPGVYREKECPKCGVTHRKKGKFCSRPCASSYNVKGRVVSEETKDKHRKNVREFLKTPEGIAQGILNNRGVTRRHEDYELEIPSTSTIDDYDFLDNYPRNEF